jgi:NAD(P)-dependent dehydrogenase (short-subunit alcohol dehydrogenase family)
MTGKVAIITAGTPDVEGRLVAGYRERGWAVVASARTIGPSPDPDLLTIAADISDPAAAGRIVGGALKRFGRIDTLINDAVVNLAKPFTAYTPADYAVAEVSLAGFFWLTQRAIAEMAIRYGGHVVSVLAATADNGDSGAPAVLAALTRGGQAAATRSLAREYASLGIRVNAVVLGLIEAPRPPARSCDIYDGRFPPLPRGDQIGDVVNAVLFLESSPSVTGQVVHVGGG